MVAFFELFARNVQGIDAVADRTRAIVLAESRLDDLGVAGPLVAGTTAGRFDDRFAWQVDVAPLHAAPAPRFAMVPYSVRVTVSWPGRRVARTLSLESVRLGAAQ